VSNSEVVEERVSRDYECVTCGWSEFDVREIVAVPTADKSLIGERYEECRDCGETYENVGGESNGA